MKSKIMHAASSIDALKSSGYKSTYNAIAEIVDNSIDANAKNIFIIGEQTASITGDAKEKSIVSFAFLDDGEGMNYETLNSCLSIGVSNKKHKKGMGRFGVGLPQASTFVCNRVEVYSWQNGIDNCQMTYLDWDEIVNDDLNDVEYPQKKSIPEQYKVYLNWRTSDGKQYDFKQNGTLVVWTKCTRVDHRKWNTCVKYMSEDLGRKYRYYIDNDGVNIAMCELTSKDYVELLPNDPLYLISHSQDCLPNDLAVMKQDGYISLPYKKKKDYTENMFEEYLPTDDSPSVVNKKILYFDKGEKREGIVQIKYSVVKKKYYSRLTLNTDKKPGSLPYGSSQRIKNNVGISIVREGREIEFGSFGFYDQYNVPEYRWWGIEINFGSELDAAFGVSNNKQFVDLKPLSKQDMEEYTHDEVKPIWMQLAEEIKPTILAMTERNSKIRDEVPEKDANSDVSSTIGDIVNSAEKRSGEVLEIPEDNKDEEQKKMEVKEALENEGFKECSPDQIKEFQASNVRVITHSGNRNDNFITYSYAASVLIINLNKNHPFYELFVSQFYDKEEQKIAFQILLSALMKSIKELDLQYPDAMDLLTRKINNKIFDYVLDYKNKNN
ncbi:MAG: ATP-binding protein [Clostridia bacterium]|nr:ATP-binding protein [Clostridia bacterium]